MHALIKLKGAPKGKEIVVMNLVYAITEGRKLFVCKAWNEKKNDGWMTIWMEVWWVTRAIIASDDEENCK